MPIALALAIVTWWPRHSTPRTSALTTPALPEDVQEDRLAEAIDRARVSTVSLEYNSGDPPGKRRVATGVVFSEGGDVISVRVEPPEGRDRESIVARDSAGHEHPARFVASDSETGLTLLKVEADDIRPIRPTPRSVLLGATVFLIGHPYDLGQSVSLGNIAGLNRRVKYGPRSLGGLIHAQVALHPGDSGALLADRKGGWLGLIRGGLVTDAKDDNSLGFAIPAIDALWIAEQLLAHRKVDRAFLGVKLATDSREPGAQVTEVIASSPAEKAGLREGDRVVRLDDRPIRNPDDLHDRLDLIHAGTDVTLECARGQKLVPLTVRTTTRPAKAHPAAEIAPTTKPANPPAPPVATPPTS